MEIVNVILAAIVFLVILVDKVIHRKHRNYWRKHNVVEKSQAFVAKNKSEPFFVTDYRDYVKYGAVHGTRVNGRLVLVVQDMEIVKQIATKDFHLFSSASVELTFWYKIIAKFVSSVQNNRHSHKAIKRCIPRSFSRKKRVKIFEIVEKCTNDMIKMLDDSSCEQGLDMKHLWGCYTLNVIVKLCFDIDVNSYWYRDSRLLERAKIFLTEYPLGAAIFLSLPPSMVRVLITKASNPSWFEFFSRMVAFISKKREPNFNRVTNFLKFERYMKQQSKSRQISVDALFFLFTVYETTASILTFATYVLAKTPDIQAKLHAELLEMQKNNEVLRQDQLVSLKYLDAFISETIRYFPPVLRQEKIAKKDYIIPQNKLRVPKGTVITFSPYCLGRNAKYFKSPEKFDPDRFLNTESQLDFLSTLTPPDPASYAVMQFVKLQVKLCLAKVLLRFEFLECQETKMRLEFLNGFEFLTAKSVSVAIKRRRKA